MDEPRERGGEEGGESEVGIVVYGGGGGIRGGGILWGDDASPRRWSVMGCCAGDASFLSREGRGELDIFLAEFYLLLFEIGNSFGDRIGIFVRVKGIFLLPFSFNVGVGLFFSLLCDQG